MKEKEKFENQLSQPNAGVNREAQLTEVEAHAKAMEMLQEFKNQLKSQKRI